MSRQTSPKQRTGLLIGLLAFAQLIISIDYNIVYVALPEIDRVFDFSDQTLQWVVSAYALSFGGLLLLGGRACDLFGARRIYLSGLALYAIGSAFGGLAVSTEWILAARVVQGIGGALLFPSVLTLISTRFTDDASRNRAFAVWGTAGGAGMVLGSLLGGVLTESLGWSSVFWVNVPLALGTILLSLRAVTPDEPRTAKRSFDLGGAVTATGGISLVIFALVQGPEIGWTSVPVIGAAVLGLALLGAFAAIERRHSDPLLPSQLTRDANLRAGSLVTFLYMGSFGALLYFLTLFFQIVQGFSALETGLAFLVPMIGIVAGAQVGGRLVTGQGPRRVMVGSALIGAVGVTVTAVLLVPDASFWILAPGLLVTGLGQGAGWTVMFAGATQTIHPYDQGIASGIASTTQQIGGATGLAVLVAVANSFGAADPTGLRVATALVVVGIVATALAATRFERPARTPSDQPVDETVAAA